MSTKQHHEKILECVRRIYQKAKRGFLDKATVDAWLTELHGQIISFSDPELSKQYNRIKTITDEALNDGPVTVDEFQRPLLRLEYYSRRRVFGEKDERVKEVANLLSRQRHNRYVNESVFSEARM